MDPTLWPVLLLLGAGIGFLAGLLGIGGGMTLVPHLTIIFTSQDFPAPHVGHMAGATEYLTKPFDASTVLTAVAGACAPAA